MSARKAVAAKAARDLASRAKRREEANEGPAAMVDAVVQAGSRPRVCPQRFQNKDVSSEEDSEEDIQALVVSTAVVAFKCLVTHTRILSWPARTTSRRSANVARRRRQRRGAHQAGLLPSARSPTRCEKAAQNREGKKKEAPL